MAVSKDFVDELRSRINISEIVGKYVKLTRAGREYKACCPFHKEKTASFTLNDEKSFYHCFGCGAHGDIVKFVMDYRNLTFMEAIEFLAGIAGMQIPKDDGKNDGGEEYRQQALLFKLFNTVNEYYKYSLRNLKNKNITRYLIDRGFSSSDIEEYDLGYSDFEGKDLRENLNKLGFKDEDLIASGLFKKSQHNQNDYYPFFRNRIMFAVRDVRGRVVAFGGRILPEEYSGQSTANSPKYINSAENIIFHKGRMLYGLNKAVKSMPKHEDIVVVEGYVDVISMHKAGFVGTVAPLGTALTETQVEELWKRMPDGHKIPILCFDGDNAGKKAASRALTRILPILKPDVSVKFAFLPEGYDPDDLVRQEGSVAMRKVLDSSLSLFDMLWQEESMSRDLAQPEAKAGLKHALTRRASEIQDNDVRKFFLDSINQKFSEFSSSKTFTKYQPKTADVMAKNRRMTMIDVPIRPGDVKVSAVQSPIMKQEKLLLGLLVLNPFLYDQFAEMLGSINLENQKYDRLRLATLDYMGENETVEVENLQNFLNQAGYTRELEDILNNPMLNKGEDKIEIVVECFKEIIDKLFKNNKKT